MNVSQSSSLGRALPVEPNATPVDAVRTCLLTSNNLTPWHLWLEAVEGLYPARYRGEIIPRCA